jgi:hypothetical protein
MQPSGFIVSKLGNVSFKLSACHGAELLDQPSLAGNENVIISPVVIVVDCCKFIVNRVLTFMGPPEYLTAPSSMRINGETCDKFIVAMNNNKKTRS